ncbi:TetR/AcrR family transcriptional regulator [Rhodopseudomonas sp. BAL398]|uniref:TetR/AcrR family transcriptional regulator n=1 Tax=Rhodopseudomonas sp. BAL398 TaxID=3034676 RepID=UPI0023E2BE4C|nr:TetR/AcrR family transcriptional regulator [Rhodopseudomonas sp. BAL398]MDF3813712.1 TetR/AcrR family transcriptional regulator [Rhodopseudomonas sp. BAL398]
MKCEEEWSVARLSREESRERTRALLRRAAAANFAKYGFEGASVDQISEAAGFSRGAFYSNFADKEAIFLDLLVQHLEHDIDGFKRIAAESRTLEELITGLTASYRDLGQRPDWCLLSSEFQLYASRVGRPDSEFSRAYEDFRQRLSALLDEAFQRFDFRGELSARQLASAIIGLSHGLALERAASKVNLPMEVTGMAIRALLFGAAASNAGVR